MPSATDNITNILTEPETGIIEYTTPQEVDAGEWIGTHIDCDTIIEDLGDRLLVYAFATNPHYNKALLSYKRHKYGNLCILKGVSENAIGSLV